MKLKILFGIGILAVAAIVILALNNGGNNSRLAAPDFTVYDENGTKYTLSEFAGKPIIINIWATWCPPCRRELPCFDKLAREYGGRVQFLMIDSEEKSKLSTVKDFVKKGGYTFPLYYDWDDSAYDAYGTGYIPITIAINAGGDIVYNDTGAMDENSLRSVIKKIL